MKTLMISLVLLASHCISFAGRVPSGFMEIGELEEAKAKAAKSGKLVAIVVKGSEDSCPRCAEALENGTRAIKSDVVLVFARVPEVQPGKGLPESVTKETSDAVDGAWVTFYVFDAALETLVAESSRKELESDRSATKAFKDKVDVARKALAGK